MGSDTHTSVANLYDEGLLRILRVEIKDLNTGCSTFSRSEIMQVSMKRYKRMAELVIKQLESVKS